MLSAMGPQYQKYLWWKRYMTELQIVSRLDSWVLNDDDSFYVWRSSNNTRIDFIPFYMSDRTLKNLQRDIFWVNLICRLVSVLKIERRKKTSAWRLEP